MSPATSRWKQPTCRPKNLLGIPAGALSRSGNAGGPIHISCLTAGTPIWTDAGPVAVEKIKVGDRVLAQDPETGELAYKPVLHTTVRLKAELVKLELLDDTIMCSVGHRFWIAGKGWVKARDIQPNMHFHGAAGTTPLRRSEPAGVGPVYNLIVADFHSYFVGKALIYSHDITARKPSDLLVPGLRGNKMHAAGNSADRKARSACGTRPRAIEMAACRWPFR